MPIFQKSLRFPLYGVAAGLIYGLAFRLAFAMGRPNDGGAFVVLSVAFLFCVPFALGFAQIFVSEKQERLLWRERVVLPWIPSVLCLAVSMALGWEGLICVILFLPVCLVTSSAGGVLAGLVRDIHRPTSSNLVFLCCLLLPLAVSPLERLRPVPTQLRTVETAIEISASPEAIWEQIKSVPAIRREELRETWTHRMGFPRPVAATLSHDGIGGVRRASFEGGVLFFETVNRWEPLHELAFTIRADMASIPAATLDEHVTIGGPYFDVLEGEYRIEPITAGRAILRLSSRHRLSTRFNLYARLWSDAILSDIQQNILLVIKQRSEKSSSR
ncbi:MAG: hypothetical protein ABJF23_09205 [Bryobacteraceae bacterium]